MYNKEYYLCCIHPLCKPHKKPLCDLQLAKKILWRIAEFFAHGSPRRAALEKSAFCPLKKGEKWLLVEMIGGGDAVCAKRFVIAN